MVCGKDGAVERGIHRGVDAAGDADHDFGYADGGEKFPDAVAHGEKKQVSLPWRHGGGGKERAGGSLEMKCAAGFFKGSGFGKKPAVLSISGGHAVKGVAGLAVVLQPPAIHVEHRDVETGELGGEHAVAFFIFGKREGRGGQIQEKIGALGGKDIHGREAVIFIPAVFAEERREADHFAAEGNHKGRECFFGGRAFFSREGEKRGKIAAVIETAVIGQQRFHRIGTMRPFRREECAVFCEKSGIVFSGAAIVIRLCPVDGDVSPRDHNVSGCFSEAVIVSLCLAQEGILVPQVSDEITGETHLGKNEKVRSLLFGECDLFFDERPVGADIPRQDVELGGADSEHGWASFVNGSD